MSVSRATHPPTVPTRVGQEEVIIRTERLALRPLTESDLPELRAILQDEETMTAYEGAFSETEVQAWLAKARESYREAGFGLWAVVLAEGHRMIGQCGITLQEIEGECVHEVGYLFNPQFWGQGYAREAAQGCVDYAFNKLDVTRVYAQIRDSNLSSMNVAIRLGMTARTRFIKRYRGVDMPHICFAVDRADRG